MQAAIFPKPLRSNMKCTQALMIRTLLCLALGSWTFAAASSMSSNRLREHQINLLPQDILLSGSKNYTPQHLAGYFKLNRTHDAHMFYFSFEHRYEGDAPIVLWMTGGPGCSSELAVFFENGPYKINKDLTLRPNEYGWDAVSTIIYVDQPIGTGFSYSNDPRDRVFTEKIVAADMLDFILAYLEAHPENKGRAFYVVGESYAGHYVPAVSYGLYKYNKANPDSPINLKGLAIGNGLTNPGIQYGAYGDFAAKNGLIGKTVQAGINELFPICKFGIDICNAADVALVCQIALTFCQNTQFLPILVAAGNINVYDITKPCEGPLCYKEFDILADYINQPHVRKELGVNKTWQACSPDVYQDFQGDWMKNYAEKIPPMLEDDLQVMIYAGVLDLICNYLGNERWLDALEWSNSTAFAAAEPEEWVVNGTTAGTVRTASKLSFVKINGAGHLSPMDQPERLLDMIDSFINKKPLPTSAPATPLTRTRVNQQTDYVFQA